MTGDSDTCAKHREEAWPRRSQREEEEEDEARRHCRRAQHKKKETQKRGAFDNSPQTFYAPPVVLYAPLPKEMHFCRIWFRGDFLLSPAIHTTTALLSKRLVHEEDEA